MQSLKKLFVGISLFSTLAHAQNKIYVNEYLNIGVGGRGLALAGSQIATTTDVYSSYWNPAGLMKIKEDLQVGLMHSEYFSGIAKYDYLAVATPVDHKGSVLAFSAMRFGVDDIPYTIDFVQPDGSFDYSKLRSISAEDYAFLISYAQKINIFSKKSGITTNIGVNAKIIYRHLGTMANAWGGGIDLGLQAQYKSWRFGIMAKDITTTVTAWSFNLTDQEKQIFGQTHNDIPINSYETMLPRFNIGVGKYFIKPGKKFQILSELSADITTDGQRNTVLNSETISISPHMGLEVNYRKAIYLRFGVGNFQKILDDKDSLNKNTYILYQPSAGLGINIGSFAVDYAFTSLQTQKNPLYSHVFSLKLSINHVKYYFRKKDHLDNLEYN